jgi:hypothetical protein
MKLKTILFALMGILTLNVFSQFPINLTVIGDVNCPYTVTGMYIDSLNQTTGELVLTSDPSGVYTTSVPMVGSDIYVYLCATNCMGMTQCTGGIVIFGAINTYTIDLTSVIDSDGDGWGDDVDCGPFDPYTHPQAMEMCDGIDNNCDGQLEMTPSLNMYFVSDSVVTEDNTIFLINQSSNCIGYSWTFGNGDSANVAYPTTTYGGVGTYQICVGGYSIDGCVADTCLTFTIDSMGWYPGGIMTEWVLNVVDSYTVGVEETMTNNVKVWPNPVSGMINVSTPSNNGNIKIMSVDGRCVYQNKYIANMMEIDSENLSQGTYVIMINDDSGKLYTTKIVK